MEENKRTVFFALNNDGDSATVRLLHTKVETIEIADIHRVEGKDGKKKSIKCVGNDCPLCESGDKPSTRIWIHLWDYADNTEKVWDRTDKILSKFQAIQDSGYDLNECVLKITRKGKDFPQYDVTQLNPKNFDEVDPELIDKKVGFKFYFNRTVDDIKTFLATGEMPKKESTFIPKEEYLKQKQAEKESPTASNPPKAVSTASNDSYNRSRGTEDSPFFDPFSRPRRM